MSYPQRPAAGLARGTGRSGVKRPIPVPPASAPPEPGPLRVRVTLTGSVDSQEHASRAEQIARSTEGVKEVDNRLEAAYSSYGPIRREASCPIAENWPC